MKQILLLIAGLLFVGIGCSSNEIQNSEIQSSVVTPTVQFSTSSLGQLSNREVRDLLVSKLGIKNFPPRKALYNHVDAISADGTLVASAWSYHNDRFIQVLDNKNNVEHQYVNTHISGMVEESGDLYFSPDGKKLAYALYGFETARNDEVLIGAMAHVYIIDLQTGKQSELQSQKDNNFVLRVTGWTKDLPDIAQEPITEQQKPGEVPYIYIPYTFN